MVKIFMTCRNRLEITKKSIEALYKHSKFKFNLYVYDNLTDYNSNEHFSYFYQLYEKGYISQVTFNTKESTYNAFSKAVACNQFGYNHLMDPEKNKYHFLLFIDNDIIVTPDWDKILIDAWKDVNNYNLKHIKVIGQYPGGIKYVKNFSKKIGGKKAKIGKLGGSGFWSIRPNFFDDVGFLPIKRLVGINKKHDQMYWSIMDRKNNKKPYILGLEHLLCIHTGGMVGSICNSLTKDKNSDISFKEKEEKIKNLNFNDFYKKIINNKSMLKNW